VSGDALSVWYGGSPGAAAVAGRDLVLEVPLEHGLLLPQGAALDDYLDERSRPLVDRIARERFERWRGRRTEALTVDGLDLISLCELELLAQCFVSAARLEIGLPPALETARVGRAILRAPGGADGIAGTLRAVAAGAGVAVETEAVGEGARLEWRGASRPVRAAASLGFPARVRGQVICVPYWILTPVFERLLERGAGTTPVAAGIVLPGLDRRSTLQVAVRGGWMGHAGTRSRQVARGLVEQAVRFAAADRPDGDAIDAALDGWALQFVAEHAPSPVTAARWARRAFARGSVRAVVVPFDRPATVAALVVEARAAGIPSLLVQHGFDQGLGVPDKTHVDVAALWSERDRSILRDVSSARPVVTGNPGAEHLASPGARAPRRDRTLLLVDYQSRLSASVPERVSQLHLTTALEAVAAARPGTTAVIRPHPASLGAETTVPRPAGIAIEVDATTPIETLSAGVDACVGAMSTATLQAGACGVPVVYLDVAGLERPWPFDGSAVPVARDASQLADELAAAVERPEVTGQADLLEALGARRGGTAAVTELVAELAAGRPA